MVFERQWKAVLSVPPAVAAGGGRELRIRNEELGIEEGF
jgi:hypothetical protein